ncbi:MAG: hypothetical protein WAU14_04325, partial [Dokdonella sp.]|uniref:hypothetical protein n=1 Tax=Dokdonella sp. TaxID=2291710 RepID=UPI003BB1B861
MWLPARQHGSNAAPGTREWLGRQDDFGLSTTAPALFYLRHPCRRLPFALRASGFAAVPIRSRRIRSNLQVLILPLGLPNLPHSFAEPGFQVSVNGWGGR